MKKMILIACCSAFALGISIGDARADVGDAIADESSSILGGDRIFGDITPYGGLSLNANFMRSEYAMDFEVNQVTVPFGGGTVRHKKSRKKVGLGVFLGVSGGEDFYYAFEIGANFNRPKVEKRFSGKESFELEIIGRTDDYLTHQKTSYGNEYDISLKFGKNFKTDRFGPARLYVILGLSTRNAKVEYNYTKDTYPAHFWDIILDYYDVNYKKHIWAFAPGVGAEIKLGKNFSLGMEYKHKFYRGAKTTRDFSETSALPVIGGVTGAYDTMPRNYKVKTGQDSLSLRFIANI